MADVEAVEIRLWATADQVASLGFTDPCKFQVQQFIRDGVQRMLTEGKLGDESSIASAEANLGRFVRQMTMIAQSRGLSMLNESTFNSALSLCPLWPFC